MPRAAALAFRMARRVVGIRRFQLHHHAAQKASGQLVGQAGDQPGVLVGGQDDRGAGVQQGIEGVQELVLSGPFRGQEMHVVDDEGARVSIPGAEAVQRAGAHGVEKAVGECLGSEMHDVETFMLVAQGPREAFEQVRLAQSDASVNHQGVEAGTGRAGHLHGRGVRQAAAGADDEIL